MKAIETKYKGYRFRSRLEARWAVFFDEMGVRWEYEPEGFDLDDGTRYLPDFKVTSKDGAVRWYEIKPRHIRKDKKLDAFADALSDQSMRKQLQGLVDDESALLLSGDPLECLFEQKPGDDGRYVCLRCGLIGQAEPWFWTSQVDMYCWPCDVATPCGGDNPPETGLFVDVIPHKGFLCVETDSWEFHVRSVRICAEKARSARFEFGECGAAV